MAGLVASLALDSNHSRAALLAAVVVVEQLYYHDTTKCRVCVHDYIVLVMCSGFQRAHHWAS